MTSRGCRDQIDKGIAMLAMLVLVLVMVGWLAALLDPSTQTARQQRAAARAREDRARAEAAEAWSDAWSSHAGERAAALTYGMMALVAIGVGASAGLAVTVVTERRLRARQLHADAATGLFPVVRERPGLIINPNEPRAQTLAALAAARRPTAASVARVLDAPVTPQISEPQGRPESGATWPAKVDIYHAPIAHALALPVGVGGAGRPVELPLRNLGNVLIGGLPGAGKSELLASMVAGLLRQDATGQQVRVAVVDTKLVSFGALPDLAALWARPALELDDAHALTEALVAEVQRRYRLLRAADVRSIEEYRARTGETLPYVVTVIDELVDMTADSDRRRAAAWLASAQEIGRKGRAAGVGLVMATQRPSADVIPASLRNLAGASVAFRVARNHDSVAILGETGAELLPPAPGRCLVRHRETIQVQAYMAGLEGGAFDRYCKTLPQVDSVEAAGWPVRETGIPASPPAQPPASDGIPLFCTTQTQGYTDEQVQHIRDRYADLGSLKAVQRELYGQEGGVWFYRIREAIGR